MENGCGATRDLDTADLLHAWCCMEGRLLSGGNGENSRSEGEIWDRALQARGSWIIAIVALLYVLHA